MDTLAIVKKMTAAGMPAAQAEAVAETFVGAIEGDLATKRDLKEVEAGLKRDLKEVEAGLKRDLKEVEAGLKRDIKELELKTEELLADMQRHNLQVGLGMALFTITVLGFLIRFLR